MFLSFILVSKNIFPSASSEAIPDWIKETVKQELAPENLDLHPTDVIFWKIEEALIYKDKTASLSLRLQTKQNFSLYKSELNFKTASGIPLSLVKAPKTYKLKDPISEKIVEVYQEGTFTFVLAKLSLTEQEKLQIKVRYLGCTQRICLFPYTEKLKVNFTVSSKPLDARYQKLLQVKI